MRKRVRLGVLLGMASATLAWFAALAGGPAWILLWPAGSLAWVSVCYLFVGARGFGRGTDGRIRAVARLALAPFLLLRQVTWVVQGLVGGEPPYQRVGQRLFLGRYPAQGLPDEVTVVVDFTCEFSAAPHGRRLVSLPCLDGIPPSAAQVRACIAVLDERDGVAYVHCASGHGRSATAVAAWLIASGTAESVDGAQALLQSERPGVRLTAEQAARANEFRQQSK